MDRWRIPLLVFVVFCVAVFLRTYHLAELPPGLYPDEAMNGSNALEAIATGNYKVYYPENNGREGLFMNIQAQFLRVLVPANGGNPEPWMLRIVSTIFGSLTVLAMFFLGRELFRSSQFSASNGRIAIGKADFIGLAAMFFTATSFWHINFSRIGFRAIMAPFFLVLAVALLHIAIRKGGVNQTLRYWLFAIGAGAVYGAGFYSYIAYRVSPLLLLLFIPFFRKVPNFWKVAGIFVAVTFFVALPIGLYYFQNPADFFGRTTQVSVFSSTSPLRDLALNTVKTLGMFNFVGDFNERHNLSGAPELFWPVGILFLLGIWFAFKRWRSFGSATIFSWFLLALLPVVISNEGLPHALRSVLLIPPTMLFAAVGAAWGYEQVAGYRLQVAGTVLPALMGFAAAVCIAQVSRQYFVAWADHPDTPGAFAANYVGLGREIRALPADIAKYVVVDAGGVDVRGIPMPAQTVMYMTDSFTPEKQAARNIHYVLPAARDTIPVPARIFEIQ